MHDAHMHNLVAKVIRELYPTGQWGDDPHIVGARATLRTAALKFAERFAQDERFDPVAFLDHCSPNPLLYPFSDMWEER